MRTMFKYAIGFRGSFWLPPSAIVRHFDTQRQGTEYVMAMWVEVDPDDAITRARQFVVLGTGHAIPEGAVYVATHLQDHGSFVWHLFELADG